MTQNQRLDRLIADIQMLALSLSTQRGAEERRLTLIKLREVSYEATSEVTLYHIPNSLHTHPISKISKPRFGVNDL